MTTLALNLNLICSPTLVKNATYKGHNIKVSRFDDSSKYHVVVEGPVASNYQSGFKSTNKAIGWAEKFIDKKRGEVSGEDENNKPRKRGGRRRRKG